MSADTFPTHTPGPWFVTSQDDYPTGEVSADPMGVRTVVTTYGDDAKANARLIAAAPELAAALVDCVRTLRAVRTTQQTTLHDRTINAALQALTKAEVFA